MSTRNIVVSLLMNMLFTGAACVPTSGSAKLESAQGKEMTQAPKSNSASPVSANELSKAEAEGVATKWLNALRTRDRVQLQKLTAVPFELAELVQYPKCQPAEASKPEDIAGAVPCLLEDHLLMEELAAQPEPVTEMIAAADLPAWAASLKQSPPAHGKLVHIRLPGNGVSYQFIVLATLSGVQRVWKFAEYDSN